MLPAGPPTPAPLYLGAPWEPCFEGWAGAEGEERRNTEGPGPGARRPPWRSARQWLQRPWGIPRAGWGLRQNAENRVTETNLGLLQALLPLVTLTLCEKAWKPRVGFKILINTKSSNLIFRSTVETPCTTASPKSSVRFSPKLPA